MFITFNDNITGFPDLYWCQAVHLFVKRVLKQANRFILVQSFISVMTAKNSQEFVLLMRGFLARYPTFSWKKMADIQNFHIKDFKTK